METKLFKIKDKPDLYTREETPFLSSYRKLKQPKVDAEEIEQVTFQWKGAKIPFYLYQKMVAFFKKIHDEHSAECQVRFFYNPDEDKWDMHAFPQKGLGLSTEEKETCEEYKSQRTRWPEPWFNFGTGHHHCDIKAFQSGTDEANERNQDGLHITLGELDSPKMDYHGRLVFAGVTYLAPMSSWFELSEDILEAYKKLFGELPTEEKELQELTENILLRQNPGSEFLDPVWVKNFEKAQPQSYFGWRDQYSGYGEYWWESGTNPHKTTQYLYNTTNTDLSNVGVQAVIKEAKMAYLSLLYDLIADLELHPCEIGRIFSFITKEHSRLFNNKGGSFTLENLWHHYRPKSVELSGEMLCKEDVIKLGALGALFGIAPYMVEESFNKWNFEESYLLNPNNNPEKSPISYDRQMFHTAPYFKFRHVYNFGKRKSWPVDKDEAIKEFLAEQELSIDAAFELYKKLLMEKGILLDPIKVKEDLNKYLKNGKVCKSYHTRVADVCEELFLTPKALSSRSHEIFSGLCDESQYSLEYDEDSNRFQALSNFEELKLT